MNVRLNVFSPAAFVALLVSLGVGCGGPSPTDARDRAIDYFGTHVRQGDPGWSSIFGLLHRRFGLTVPLANGQPAHAAPGPGGEVAAVYQRLLDPNARTTLRQVAELPTPIDRMTATALHCTTLGLPDDWVDVLGQGTSLGAYALTHAVAATRWTLENGCLPDTRVVALELAQVDALVRLLDARHTLASRHALATDIWIEALAMLHYLDAAEHVRPEWVDDLLAAQRADGGWPNHPDDDASHPHPTALALWILLEQLEPGAPATPWVPQP